MGDYTKKGRNTGIEYFKAEDGTFTKVEAGNRVTDEGDILAPMPGMMSGARDIVQPQFHPNTFTQMTQMYTPDLAGQVQSQQLQLPLQARQVQTQLVWQPPLSQHGTLAVRTHSTQQSGFPSNSGVLSPMIDPAHVFQPSLALQPANQLGLAAQPALLAGQVQMRQGAENMPPVAGGPGQVHAGRHVVRPQFFPAKVGKDWAYYVEALAELNIQPEVQPTFNKYWTPSDEMAAAMFQLFPEGQRSKKVPWTTAEELLVAKKLECFLPFFDAHIGNSDEGMSKFIARHRFAMEQGWTKLLPRSFRPYKSTKNRETMTTGWEPYKWECHYGALAKTREKVVNCRLKFNLGLKPAQYQRF